MINKTKLFLISVILFLAGQQTNAQDVRGFYLQDVGDWLGDASEENEILEYAQGNGFNYILFYDLGDINWNSSTEKNQLAAFIKKARTQYGIDEVGGVIEYAGYLSQKLIPYNNSRSSSSEKFDVINQEFEFWVSSSISSSYCSKFLSPGGFPCTKAGAWDFAWQEFKEIDDLCAANGLKSEYYLGWPDLTQMQKLAGRADRILLSAYRPTDSDIYTFSKQRMKDIATIGGVTEVLTLLSSESSFMGPWLQTHAQTRPYQTMKTAMANETSSFVNNIDLKGYHWFTYKHMPKTLLATASISVTGSLTFCAGGNVTLTANSGSQYLWSNGATTRTITVTSSGTYTVRVTNSSGLNATSSPVITILTSTGTTPTITASGSTTFCDGDEVTLTSSSSSNYLWSNGETTRSITVDVSGNYKVTTTSGNCVNTSSVKTVTVNPTPAVPVISADGPLEFCVGGEVTLTSTPASGYLWSTGETTRSITVGSDGNFSVRVYAGPNCSTPSAVTVVDANSLPSKPVISTSDTTVLSSSQPSIQLSSTSALSYLWSTGETTQTIVITNPGNYSVTVANANGCTRKSSEFTITSVNCIPPAIPNILISGSTILQHGQSVTLTSSSSTNNLWSNGATTQSITVSDDGVYTVRVYNGSNCYSTSFPVTIDAIITGIEDHQTASGLNINIYPNPARDAFSMTFNLERRNDFLLNLYDLNGRLVLSQPVDGIAGENKVNVNVAGFSSGIYFAQLGDGKRMKVLVQ